MIYLILLCFPSSLRFFPSFLHACLGGVCVCALYECLVCAGVCVSAFYVSACVLLCVRAVLPRCHREKSRGISIAGGIARTSTPPVCLWICMRVFPLHVSVGCVASGVGASGSTLVLFHSGSRPRKVMHTLLLYDRYRWFLLVVCLWCRWLSVSLPTRPPSRPRVLPRFLTLLVCPIAL